MAQVFGKVDKDALKAYVRRFTEQQATNPTPIESAPEMEPSSSSSSHAQPAGFASHSVPMSEQFKGMMSQGIKNFSGNMANIFRTVTGKLSEEQLDTQLREIERMSLTGDWSANIMMNAIMGAKDHGASKQEALQHGKDVLNQIMQASSRTPEGEAPMVDETDWRDTLVSSDPFAAWGFYIYQNA